MKIKSSLFLWVWVLICSRNKASAAATRDLKSKQGTTSSKDAKSSKKGLSPEPTMSPTSVADRVVFVCFPDKCGKDKLSESQSSCHARSLSKPRASETTLSDLFTPFQELSSLLQTDNEELAAFDLLQNSRQDFIFASLALGKTFPAGSDYLETQNFLADEVALTFEEIKSLNLKINGAFGTVSTYLDDTAAIDVQSNLQRLQSDFGNFLVSRQYTNQVGNEIATTQLQASCGAARPKDLFAKTYSYLCGTKGADRSCTDFDYGECLGGIQQRRINTALLDPSTNEISSLQTWITGNFIQLAFFDSMCSSFDVDACAAKDTLPSDPFFDEAFSEVLENLKSIDTCAGPTTKGLVPLCVVNEQGIPIPRDSVEFKTGKVIYSEISIEEADNDISEGLEDTAEVLDAIGGIAELAGPKGEALAGALGAIGGVLRVASIFQGKTEADPTETLITNGFKQMSQKLDILERGIFEGFDQVREELGNTVLDATMNKLSRIQYSYKDFIDSRELDSSQRTLKNQYTEDFRFACNEGDFRPEDIVRILYGYACGDDFENRECDAKGGVGTGTCAFGRKQRNYLLDTFKDTSLFNTNVKEGSLREFQAFTTWLEGALAQAVFFMAVCLPSDPNACLSENDPIFQNKYNAALAAVEEVYDNIQTTEEKCSKPCKRMSITSVALPDDPGAEIEIKFAISSSQSGESRFFPTSADLVEIDNGYAVLDEDGETFTFNIPLVLSGLTSLDSIEFVARNEGALDCTTTAGSTRCVCCKEDVSRGTHLPGDWYRNSPDSYTGSFEISGAGYTYTFSYRVDPIENFLCSGVCTPDFPQGSCSSTQFCASNFTCQNKQAGDSPCDRDDACLSNKCNNGTCQAQLGLGGECSEDRNCISSFKCFEEPQVANGNRFCCTNDCNLDFCTQSSQCRCGTCIPSGIVNICSYSCDTSLCGADCSLCSDEQLEDQNCP